MRVPTGRLPLWRLPGKGVMTNKPKIKGTAFESLIVDGLHDMGYPYAERRAQRGVNDGGDIAGIPGVVIQCKHWKAMELGVWLTGVEQQVKNDQADIGFVVHKRRMHANPLEQYVTTDLRTILQLLKEAGR
jgi:hypothetical protein